MSGSTCEEDDKASGDGDVLDGVDVEDWRGDSDGVQINKPKPSDESRTSELTQITKSSIMKTSQNRADSCK